MFISLDDTYATFPSNAIYNNATKRPSTDIRSSTERQAQKILFLFISTHLYPSLLDHRWVL